MTTEFQTSRILGAAAVVFGVCLLWLLWFTPLLIEVHQDGGLAQTDAFPPQLFPTFATVVLIVAGMALVLSRSTVGGSPTSDMNGRFPIISTAVVVAIFPAVLLYIGTYPGVAIITSVIGIMLGERRPLVLAVLTSSVTIFVYGLGKVFNLVFP
jgi:hypothetical protein